MSNRKVNISSLIIAIASLIIINIFVFTMIPVFTTNIWINYIFMMVAIVLGGGLNAFHAPRLPYFYKSATTIVCSIYMAVSVIAGFIFSFIFKYIPAMSVILHIVIVAAALSAYLYANNINRDVSNREAIRQYEVLNFKVSLSKMEAVVNQIGYSESYKKVVEHAYDRMKSAQTKSSPQVSVLETTVLSKLDELSQAVSEKNEANIVSLCNEIEKLINERDAQLRMMQ